MDKKLLLLFFFLFIPAAVSAKVNLSVPFTVQAPDAIWQDPWDDACEEATIAMVDAFYARKQMSKFYAKEMMLRLIRLEKKLFGFYKDTRASEIAEIMNRYFPWEAQVVARPTLRDIQRELDEGRPVIVPVHGRSLKNPYFRNGGPDYHTVVISGYDDEKKEFIAQEPGTKRGKDFRYPYDRLLGAMHDFMPNGRTRYGEPVAIFTSRQITASRFIDGDNDGLTKADELNYGTVLWLADSDGDGVSDGDEVERGFSPTKRQP